MIAPTTKLYVQLEPDAKAQSALCAVQHSLDDTVQLVAEESFHLTVIHIGLVSKLIGSLKTHSPLSKNDILQSLESLSSRLVNVVELLASNSFTLQPDGYDLFGENRSTYVIRLKKSEQLTKLHTQCLKILQDFLSEIGIEDVEEFMAQDQNLKHALSLEPHVTIARLCSNSKNKMVLQPMTFKLMPVIYQV